MSQKVIITADAACALPAELLEKWNVRIIYSSIKTSGGTFLEEAEISSENAVEYTKTTRSEPQLIYPNVKEYRDFFEKALGECPAVCHFSCSSKLGIAFHSAVEASLTLSGVHIIDSFQLSTGIGFQVLQAARLAAEGFDVPFIRKASAELQPKISVSFAAPDYECGRIAGTVSPFFVSFMEVFGLSPLATVKNGRINAALFHTKKTDFWKKYIKKEFGAGKKIDTELLFICCCNPNSFPIEKIKAEAAKYISFKRIIPVKMSPKIAFKLGTAAFGLHYLTR